MTKHLVLGVTGGIAAFRAGDLISPLRVLGIETRVAMTPAATKFVAPLTFAALSGNPVLVDEFDAPADGTIPHITWARWADIVVIAPATADFLGRVANGLASDALGSLLLALEPEKPVVLAPAMNTQMWGNPFVRANLDRIAKVGGSRFIVVEPAAKRLACGETGAGGLAVTESIVAAVKDALAATGSPGPR